MDQTCSTDARIQQLISAFQSDNYSVDRTEDVIVHNANNTDYIGIRATHNTAVIGTTGNKKKVYYIEGDPHTMGYLTGRLAEADVSRMCTDFNENIVFDFINWQIKDETLRKILGDILEDIIFLISVGIYQDVPKELQEELEGLLDGCKEANTGTKVDRKSLWVLNVGIDAILSYVYTGILPTTKKYPITLHPEMLKVPIMCNGFSAMGTDLITKNKFHYMGRDFMFPTADVFQDTATMFIRRPVNENMTISVAAPGMIGAIAGISKYGIGVGVDMSPAANCNSSRPGLNSLLLTRWSIENGINCVEAANVMVNTQRGVTWDYILADGVNDSACILEAGMSTNQLNFIQYMDDWAIAAIKGVCPDFENMLKNPSAPIQNGLMIRWNNYQYPSIYQSFNEALINAYKTKVSSYTYSYNPNDFCEDSYLDKTWTDSNCPGPYYFAPKRETTPLITLMTNHFIIPEMRLCAMNWWTAIVASGNINDIQWRYDELNHELLDMTKKGYITYNEAKDTIDFLDPAGKFPAYYNADGKPLDQVQVHGSVSILDLKELTIESHYGYYSDQWIILSLKKYLPEQIESEVAKISQKSTARA
jgi:hypothetical protein